MTTLGSASRRAGLFDLACLARYPSIVAVYDDDPAGDQARRYLASFSRVQLVSPPAHDLSDYFRLGGDLRAWIASQLAPHLSSLLASIDPSRHPETHQSWTELDRRIYQALAR